MNSTTLLDTLTSIAKADQRNEKIDITTLASVLHVSTTTLLSLLTELEQRDEISLDISSVNTETGPKHTGTIRLMKTPPDELQ